MGLLTWFGIRSRKKLDTLSSVGVFLSAQAAYAAQRSTTTYCEVKAGVNRNKLFSEPAFLEELGRCRWEAFAAVLADAILITETKLRPLSGDPVGVTRLGDRLGRLYGERLAAEQRPAHRPDGWNDLTNPFLARLAEAQANPPKPPHEIANHSVRVVMDTLPIHAEHRRHDREAISGGVKFYILALHEALEKELDAQAVMADLAAGG